MSYKLLPNGKHEWTFRLGGRGTAQKQVTDSDFKAGEKEVRRIKYEFENGINVGDSKRGVTFFDICDNYLSDKSLDNRPAARKTLTSHIKGFKYFIENYRLDCFNLRDHAAFNVVDRWMKGYKNSNNRLGGAISPQAVNRKFNTLRAIFNWAINRGLMRDNPCKRVKKFRANDPLPRFLDQEQINALFKHSPRPHFTNYCTIVLNTGMRPNEVLGLQIEQIDLPNRVITAFKQKNYRKLGSTKIKDSLIGPLKRLIGARTAGQLLDGYTTAMLRNDAEAAIKDAKINVVIRPGTAKFTIYGLRHTFASHLLMAGEPLDSVAGWLRNSPAICYKHYGHLTQEFLLRAGNKIDLVPKTQLKVVGADNVLTDYEKP